jgi:hypothetical protein
VFSPFQGSVWPSFGSDSNRKPPECVVLEFAAQVEEDVAGQGTQTMLAVPRTRALQSPNHEQQKHHLKCEHFNLCGVNINKKDKRFRLRPQKSAELTAS